MIPSESFSKTLLSWFASNKRILPWRETRDPYHIWLSEIILQQTRVEQGKPYYKSFVANFPQVGDLAEANENEVLKLWQGLGYYSRARNLHFSAKQVVSDYQGNFPRSYAGLMHLKGVGAYTAAAIASICFEERVPVVDGNVYRFISRLLGIEEPIGTPRAHTLFSSLLLEMMPSDEPGTFNQAVMEFGALQCIPRSPDCRVCPFRETCFAYARQRIADLPVKKTKTKVKEVHFNFLDLRWKNKMYLTQRDELGIWKKLFHFPMIESPQAWNEPELLSEVAGWLGVRENVLHLKGKWSTVHLLSHRRIEAQFWEIQLDQPADKNDIFEVSGEQLEAYPIPRLMEKYLEHVSK